MPKLTEEQLNALRVRAALESTHASAAIDPAFDGVDTGFGAEFPKSVPASPGLKTRAGAAAPEDREPEGADRPAPSRSSKFSWPANPKTFDFPTPLVLFKTYNPHLKPYEWQQEEQHRMGGDLNLEGLPRSEWQDPTKENPFIYNLVAANSSGKDTYIITPTVVWFMMRYLRSRVVITSESHIQLKEHTFKPISTLCETINALHEDDVFDIKEFSIKCNYTGSELRAFCTDEPSKVEGYHPFYEVPESKMMVVIGEAKSIKDTLYEAFSRFYGYSHWLQVSSPGARCGQFYKSVERSSFTKCELGTLFARRVTAFECPNISPAAIEQTRLNHGENSAPYRTGILAEFYESAEEVIIPGERLDYIPPPAKTMGQRPAGGLDVGLGIDLSEFWIVHGNEPLYHAAITTSSPNKLHAWIVKQLSIGKSNFKCAYEDVSGDMGGIGAPILRRVQEAGYPIRGVNNQSAAFNKDNYANIGAEMYFRVGRMIELGKIIPPHKFECYDRWKKQITTRKFFTNEKQKLQLEAKPKAKGRLGFSPDCADAYVLAYSIYDLSEMLAENNVSEGSKEERMAHFVQDYENRAFDNYKESEHFDPMVERKLTVSGFYNLIYK